MKTSYPLALGLALISLATPARPTASAATPRQPLAGTLYFTRYSGSPRVNKVDFRYDGGTNFYLTNLVGIVDLPGADGLVIAPDGNLIIGGQGNAVYKVDLLTATFIAATPNGSSYHMSLDPSRTRVWSGWAGTALMEIPLNPFGNGIAHNLKGDDSSVLTLAWDTAGNVYYTSGGSGGHGNVGTISLTTFTTKRLMTSLPAAHGMAYDPYTSDLILFGSDHLTQLTASPTNPVVVSDLTVGGLGITFDQGTVDGRGHLFVADNNGKLAFLDYSTTRLVSHTNNFLATPFLAPSPDDVAPISLLGASTNVADLALSLSASANPAPVHTNLTLTLTVTNKGPDAATGLKLTTTVPANVALVSATGTQGVITNDQGNLVLLVDRLANASVVSLAVVVQPISGPLLLRGNVVANEIDPYFFDNFAALTVEAPLSCVEIPGPVAWWPADGSTNDLAGTNTLTLQGTAAYGPGVVLGALSFDGIAGYAQAPTNQLWNFGTKDFSLEFWANFNTLAGTQTFLGHDEGPGTRNKWILFLNNGQLQFHINGPASGAVTIGSAVLNVPPHQWHHLAVTRASSRYTFYVDGGVVDVKTNNTAIPDAKAPLTIGQAEQASYLNGLMDEITIYSRALSATEVQDLFFAGSAGKCAAPLIVPNPLPVGVTNVLYSSQLSLAYATPSYQFALAANSGPLPPGLTLSASGLLSGSPTKAGSFPVRILGTDASNQVAQADFTLKVVTCTPPPLGLLGWWPANGDAKDALGVHHGTVQNGVQFVPGMVGRAFSLDGSSAYIDLGQWSPGAQWTVEAWVNPSALPNGRHTIVGGVNDCHDWGIALQDGQLGVLIRPPGGCSQTVRSGISPAIGTWYHVVGTCDGAVARIYVNGFLMNSAPVDLNYLGTASGTRIGSEVCCGDYFPGFIDEVSIYDRALAATEIQALFTANAAGKCAGGQPPAITVQPQSQVLAVGQDGVLTVGASGPGPLSYQWFLNQVPILGATNASLTLPGVQGPESGRYTAAVSNPSGTLLSGTAWISVINLHLYAGVVVNGIVGKNYRIDYVNSLGNTNNWITLTNFTLQASPYLFIDTQSPSVPKRFYRAVFVP